jgi:hypothetical protein
MWPIRHRTEGKATFTPKRLPGFAPLAPAFPYIETNRGQLCGSGETFS